MKQFENFFYKMENFGYYVFDSVLSAQELINIRKDLLNHQEYCKSIYSKNGITEGMDGCAHHTIGKNDSIDDFLYNFYLDDYIRAYFDSEYILNTIGGINNIPQGGGSCATTSSTCSTLRSAFKYVGCFCD